MSIKERFRDNWKTTVAGVIISTVAILAAFGVVSPEQSEELTTGSNSLLDHVEEIVAVIGGVILAFAKD